MDSVVVIPDGESSFAVNVARSLGRAGVRTIAYTPRIAPISWSWASRTRRRPPEWGVVEIAEDAARRLGQPYCLYPVDTTMFLDTIRSVDLLPPLAKLPPLPDTTTLLNVADKWTFANNPNWSQLPQPTTHLGSQFLDGDSLHFPILLKHRLGRNGSGISKIGCPQELENALAKVEPSDYIIQEWISGNDIGANVMADKGRILAYTLQKSLTKNDSYQPAFALSFFHDDEVYSTLKQIIEVLNWSGNANFDMRVPTGSTRPILLEVNARCWGTQLGSTVAGVNFPAIAHALALDLELPQTEYEDICYQSGRGALAARSGLKHSAWPFILRDPLPNLFEAVESILPGRGQLTLELEDIRSSRFVDDANDDKS